MSGASGGMMALGIFASHQTAMQQMKQTYFLRITPDLVIHIIREQPIIGSSGLVPEDGFEIICKISDSNGTNKTETCS